MNQSVKIHADRMVEEIPTEYSVGKIVKCRGACGYPFIIFLFFNVVHHFLFEKTMQTTRHLLAQISPT
jgi:hypothetical protein